jgi:branched-chain amino acid transport system ATP-binding protein
LIYAAILLVVLRFLPSGLVGAALQFARDAAGRLGLGASRSSAAPPGSAAVPAGGRQEDAAPLPLAVRERPLHVAGGPSRTEGEPARDTPGHGPDSRSPDGSGDLALEHIDVRFGGLEVLSDVGLRVRPGAVRGLIGPNGAGKTTLFNVASGFVRPSRGQVSLAGSRIDELSPADRAAAGIARTFQAVHMFEELSVLDNVVAGMHTRLRDGLLACTLNLTAVRAETRLAREQARELLEWVGVGQLADRSPRGLPFGSLKLIEIARALAMRPKFLLLDEPVGGLHPDEIELLERLIVTICETGVGVLLVEHNVPFVLRACHEILVLNYGHVIADGTSDDILRSEAVVEAYLGRAGVKS